MGEIKTRSPQRPVLPLLGLQTASGQLRSIAEMRSLPSKPHHHRLQVYHRACPGGRKCTHPPISSANCPPGPHEVSPSTREQPPRNRPCLNVANSPHGHSQSTATELCPRTGLHSFSHSGNRLHNRHPTPTPARPVVDKGK